MGAVEDVRKLLQDVVTPDLKALQERMTASEKRLDAKIEALDEKLGLTRDLLVAKIESLDTVMRTNHAALLRALDIDRRLERIEREMSSEAAAKTMERAS